MSTGILRIRSMWPKSLIYTNFFLSLRGVDKVISFADYVKLINYVTNRYEPEYYSLPREPFELRMVVNNYKGLLGQDMFEGFMNNDMSKANILLRTHISSSCGLPGHPGRHPAPPGAKAAEVFDRAGHGVRNRDF